MKIVIRLPENKQDFNLGLELLQSAFRDRFGIFPKELPHIFFLAFDEHGKVIGTLNLQPGACFEKIEVEKYFQVNIEALCMRPRHEIGEIGRFAGIDRFVIPYLFCAMKLTADKFNIKSFISFNKKAIGRMMNANRFSVGIHQNIPLRTGEIDPYQDYFMKNPPVVMTAVVDDWTPTVEHLISNCDRKIRIILPDTLDWSYQNS